MSEPRYEPDDPREWLRRATSNLRLASLQDPGVYLEELCYHGQQAAEKAIKAVFVKLGRPFPYTHNLARLLEVLAQAGVAVPAEVREAVDLTRFAFEARYPAVGPAVTSEQYQQCLKIARSTVEWAEKLVLKPPAGESGS